MVNNDIEELRLLFHGVGDFHFSWQIAQLNGIMEPGSLFTTIGFSRQRIFMPSVLLQCAVSVQVGVVKGTSKQLSTLRRHRCHDSNWSRREYQDTLRCQTKEPELRPHTAAIPNVDHGGGISESYLALQWLQHSTRKFDELVTQADSDVHG